MIRKREKKRIGEVVGEIERVGKKYGGVGQAKNICEELIDLIS